MFSMLQYLYNQKTKKTKMKKNILKMALALAGISMCMQSCLSNNDSTVDDKSVANAVVTVKNVGGKSLLQLNDTLLLTPSNMTLKTYNKEVRALCNLSDINSAKKTVFVNWLDTILTKPVAENLGVKNDATYGNDPVEIVGSFETNAEDGYVTLRFRTYWAGVKQHAVNLVHRTDANNPYVLQFYHNANGETQNGQYPLQAGDGITAFKLPASFNAGNDTISITLRWKSFDKQSSGDSIKTGTLKYFPRKN